MNQKIWCFLGVHSYGPEKDGKFTCEVCGKLAAAECSHSWEEQPEKTLTRYFTRCTEQVHVLKCIKCGELKNHFVSTSNTES